MKRTTTKDYAEITAVVQKYIDGCNEGKSAVMKPAFDNGAVMYGTKADGSVEATVNWHGLTFTDYHSLMKINGEWKIVAKVYHTHAELNNAIGRLKINGQPRYVYRKGGAYRSAFAVYA